MARTIANTKDGIRRLNTEVTNCSPDFFAVRLYQTIVYFETKTQIILEHGGWVTPTTTSRIHQALRHRGHTNSVNIKNREMFCDGKPFVNGKFVIEKAVA